MLSRPAVAITALICATLFALGALAGVVYLASTDHDASVVGLLIGGPIVAVLTVIAKRLGAVKEAVNNATPYADGK